jgi:hypothetical protein
LALASGCSSIQTGGIARAYFNGEPDGKSEPVSNPFAPACAIPQGPVIPDDYCPPDNPFIGCGYCPPICVSSVPPAASDGLDAPVTALDTAGGTFASTNEQLAETGSDSIEPVRQAADGAPTTVDGLSQSAVDTASQIADETAGTVQGLADDTTGTVLDTAQPVVNRATDAIDDLPSTVEDGAETAVNELGDAVTTVTGIVQDDCPLNLVCIDPADPVELVGDTVTTVTGIVQDTWPLDLVCMDPR